MTPHTVSSYNAPTPLSKCGTNPEVWLPTSEVELVNLVIVGEGEARTEILSEKRLLGLLNVLQNGSIDTLLSSLSLL